MFIEKIWSMTIWLYTITIKWEDESSLCETVWNPKSAHKSQAIIVN